MTRLVRRAGWAPLLVFLVHGTVAGWVVDIYAPYPRLDVPMHVIGGFAIAYFLTSCVAAVPGDVIGPNARPLVEAVLVLSLTATAAVGWEFGEYVLDSLLGTHLQLGLDDTIRDMAFGILGGALFVLVRRARGELGATEPLEDGPLRPVGRHADHSPRI